ncbi:MAG: glycerol-3-phosphate acyltransferase [Oscillospiraceae bacterium]|nr:glycerol-3-phosphate acyltransferase [Oscillospiraceae bacterium]
MNDTVTMILWYTCGVIAGYLIGCCNTAAILARLKGFDIRRSGSGNAGASNALVTMGKGAAVCSALVDILKAFLPVFLLRRVIAVPESCAHVSIAVGAAVILGHMYPFWMQFHGGKGFASLLGLSLALDWRFFLIGIGITVVIVLGLRYIALATLICTVLLPAGWFLETRSLPELLILLVPALCMVQKHMINLRRIKDGTEIKFGEKKKPETSSAEQ